MDNPASPNLTAERQHLSGDQTAEQVKDILSTARKTIENPKNWTKGAFALTAYGDVCRATDPKAICWCIEGALQLIKAPWSVKIEAYRAIEKTTAGSPAEFNDTHTHAEVLKAFDDAIAMVGHQSAVEASAAVSERSERIVP